VAEIIGLRIEIRIHNKGKEKTEKGCRI